MAQLNAVARVKISGATGSRADIVNGVFVLTSGTVENGAPAYQKEGDDDKWLARNTYGQWWVSTTESRGTEEGYCYSVEAGLANPCEASSWNVALGDDAWEL
jgi:hypothetical protein